MNRFICPVCDKVNKEIIRNYEGSAKIKFSVDESRISTSEILTQDETTSSYQCPKCGILLKRREVVESAKKLKTPEGKAFLLKKG